jgi:hydroxypyruvate isomerase
MRISLNVHMLFTEAPLLERFGLAAAAGFEAVESWWPVGEDLDAYRAAIQASGLQLALLNFDGGDPAAGDRGLLSDRERAHAFRANVPVAVALAADLGCRRLNALVGLERPGQSREQQLRLAVENVRWAADLAAAQGAEVLIEPINWRDNGPYLLDRFDEAAAFIGEVGRPNVRLQFDAYHAQVTEGDAVAALERHAPLVAHVQLADAPGRGAPGSGGEVDFAALCATLDRVGYDGYVGLEHLPGGPTPDGLAWLPARLRRGAHPATELAQAIGRPVDHLR